MLYDPFNMPHAELKKYTERSFFMFRLKVLKYCGFSEGSGSGSFHFSLLIIVLFLCSSDFLFSQTTYFTAQSGLWGQGTTWVGGIAPGNADNAVIQNGHLVTLDAGGGGTIINDLTIDLGGIVDQVSLKMTINGNFVIDGSFKSNGPDLDFFGDTLAGIGSISIGASNKVLFIQSDVEILSGSQIKVSGNVSLDKDVEVTNLGEIAVSGYIDGQNSATSIWTNDIGSVIDAGGVFMNKGILNASATGNRVRYVATADQVITSPNGSAYCDLEITGSGTKTLQGDLIIGNTLNISVGILNCGNHDLDIGGDWINNGDFTEGSGTVTFSGNTDQSISHTSGEQFYNLTINKSSGILNLNGSVSVSEILTMNEGDVDTQSDTLVLGIGPGDPGSLVYTSGTILGRMLRWITSTGTPYLFPIGTSGNHRPASLTFTDLTEGALVIEFMPGDPGSAGLPLSEGSINIMNQFMEGYWDLKPQNGLASDDYSLQLTAANFNSYPVVPGTRIIKRTTDGDWLLDGLHSPATVPDVYRNNLTSGISLAGTNYCIGHIECAGLIIDRVITDVSCFGGNDGAIDVTVSGGTPPYSYGWGHGPTSEDVSTLIAGTYSLTVKEAEGCEVDSTFMVEEPVSLSAFVDSTSVTCSGGSTGIITLSGASGGSGSYEYSITGGGTWQASSDFTGLGAGIYDISIRDAAMPLCFAILDPAFELETHDLIPPVAVCRNISIQLDAAGDASITGAAIDGGSTDNCSIASLTATPNTFTCADVGPNAVVLTVMDDDGNTDFCTATVTVEDNTAPVAICKDISIPLNAAGNASITGADIDNGSNDACGIQSIVAIPSFFTCANVGPNSVTLMVTDVNGLVNTCIATVTVEDNTAPIAICRNITVQLDSTGTATITGADIDNGSNDACGIQSLVASPNTFTCTDVGLNAVTLIVTDNNGLVNTCIATVTVENNIGPIVSCRNISIQLDATGNASISGADINNGSSSTCGIQSMMVSPNTFTCSDVGMVPVTLTVADIHGNMDSCTAIVEVEDNVAPVAICRDITIQLDALGLATITGADIDNGSHDVCGIQSLDASPSLFTAADVGTNNVTLFVTDNNGHVNTCNAIVTVEDVTPPEVICKDITVQLDASGNIAITPFDVDNGSNDESGIGFLSVSPDAFSCDDLGPIQVTLTVSDIYGNENSCIAIVTVVDNLAPSLTCPGDRSEPVDGSMNFTLPDYTLLATTTDNCSSAPAITQDPLPGAIINGVGTIQRITIWANDGNGNTSQCTFNVTLVEGSAPTIACPADQTELADDQCQIILRDYTGLSIINRADTVIQTPAPGTILSGASTTHIITLTAKNLAGESAVCNFNVLILDNIPPVIVCPDDTVVLAMPGECSAAINNINPLSISDNCGVSSIEYNMSGSTSGNGMDDASGTEFNKGITSIWYRITDDGGNADSCSFNVTILSFIEAPDSAYADRNELCPDDDGSITLTYTGGTSGSGVIARWYDSPSMSASIGSGNSLTIPAPLITTAYYVRFEGDCDTTTAVNVIVTVNTLSSDPISVSSDLDTVCAGMGNINLSYVGGSPGSSGMAYWYTDAQFTNLVGTGNNLGISSPLIATTYFVRFESGCDTSSSVSTTVAVLASPSPEFTEKDDQVCISSTSSSFVVSGLPGSTFDWRLSGGTLIADYGDSVLVDWGRIPGTYSISVTENATSGCTSDPLTALVNVSSPIVNLGHERIVCEGSTIEIIPQGNFAYQMWHDGSTGTRFMADTTELVKIQVFNQAGCTAFDSVQVTMHPLPVVNLGNDTALCGNNSLLLDAGNPDATYLWSTGGTTREIEVYQGAGDISVEVTYGGECSATGEISILPCGGSSMLADIPNLFTPNGDGTNDTWFFYESAVFPEMVVEIYDRWGKRIYISEPGYPVPWDGRSMHGVDMPMDSYHYIIKPGKGYEEAVGTITIVR